MWLFCIFLLFINAFAVDALTEEETKYFGFWIVKHPDFELEGIFPKNRGVWVLLWPWWPRPWALCAVRICVFVCTPPSISNESGHLGGPQHPSSSPLAAALQSIGVSPRDLEGDCSYQLGRIILPALLLHGPFVFVLMLGSLLQSVNDDSDSHPMQGIRKELPPLISSVMIVLVALIYYICQAETQRFSLQVLDQGLQSREGTSLLV